LTNRALRRQFFPAKSTSIWKLCQQSAGDNEAICSFVLSPIWNRLVDGEVSCGFRKIRFLSLSASLRWS
jgi:hypothetical protein